MKGSFGTQEENGMKKKKMERKRDKKKRKEKGKKIIWYRIEKIKEKENLFCLICIFYEKGK